MGKGLVLATLYAFLFVPLIQELTHFKTYEGKLNGAFVEEKDISFDWPAWFSADYQAQKDKYVKENFGFHNYYVRLICQVNFNLFKKAHVVYVVVGKDNYLYETAYIDSYYGRDFVGKEKITSQLEKLKRVQDTLEKSNKLLLIVYAAGKASFYPEYIPDDYKTIPGLSNYTYYVQKSKELKLNHIDFNDYFKSQKHKSKYALYPQYGIHWSDYASIIAFDSLTKYVETKTKVNLPDLQISSVEVSDSLRNTDNDALQSLNLLFEPPTFKMAYPNWVVKYDSTKHRKPKLLVISDSFWWYIYSTGAPDNVFGPSQFWYYNHEIYPESFSSPLFVSQIDYASKIKDADVIVLMHTEATLHKFGDGFVEMCHDLFFKSSQWKQEIQIMKGKIRGTKTWFDSVVDKASKRGISTDSMLTLDAIYMLEQEKQKK